MNKAIIFFFTIICLLADNKNLLAQQPFIEPSTFDATIKPGDNFYLYVNGGFFKKMKEQNAVAKNILEAEKERKLSALLNKITNNNFPAGSGEQKIADFLNSAMDTITIEKLGQAPILPVLQKIESARSFKQLMQVAGELYKDGFVRLFGMEVRPDKKNTGLNIVVFNQAGTILPFINKSAYTKEDSISIRYLKIQSDLAISYFRVLGETESQAAIRAGQIIDLETKLTATHLDRYEDPAVTYNKMSVTNAGKAYPNIGFHDLLKAMGIITDSIIIANPNYYKVLNNLLMGETLGALKWKMKFDYLYRASLYLSNDFLIPRQQFLKAYRRAQFGSRDYSYYLQELFRDLVAELYVREYVGPEVKQKLTDIATNIRDVFVQKIRESLWMSEETKKVGIDKLNNMVMNLAYPDHWESYKDVIIHKKQLFSNYLSIAHHNYRKMIDKIDKPVDRKQWRGSPITTDASYSWEENAIEVHTGCLLLPGFDTQADDAINYAGIGTTIGHEISHAFDDNGRKYDAKGNLFNWWSEKDNQEFKKLFTGMVEQYSNFTVYDSLRINGKSTFNENFADLSGLIIAYETFKKINPGSDTIQIDGFTLDQRFFISYSLNKGAYEPTPPGFAARFRASSSNATHAPNEIRVNGSLSNFEPFYQAFNITESNKMFIKKKERIIIW